MCYNALDLIYLNLGRLSLTPHWQREDDSASLLITGVRNPASLLDLSCQSRGGISLLLSGE